MVNVYAKRCNAFWETRSRSLTREAIFCLSTNLDPVSQNVIFERVSKNFAIIL